MSKHSGWVKEYRSIDEWEWISDHLMYRMQTSFVRWAYIEEKNYRGVLIPRGSFPTNMVELSKKLYDGTKRVRLRIKRLLETEEIRYQKVNNFYLLTVTNYDTYQGEGKAEGNQKASIGQPKGIDRASIGQPSGIIGNATPNKINGLDPTKNKEVRSKNKEVINTKREAKPKVNYNDFINSYFESDKFAEWKINAKDLYSDNQIELESKKAKLWLLASKKRYKNITSFFTNWMSRNGNKQQTNIGNQTGRKLTRVEQTDNAIERYLESVQVH